MANDTAFLSRDLPLLPGELEDDTVGKSLDGLAGLPGLAVGIKRVLGLVLAAIEGELLVVVEEVRVVLGTGPPLLALGLHDLLGGSLSSGYLAAGITVSLVVSPLPVVRGRAVVAGAREEVLDGGKAIALRDGVAANDRGQQHADGEKNASKLHFERVECSWWFG